MEPTKKLYRVKLRGIGSRYVVAINTGEAYGKVKKWCGNNNYTIELIAEDCENPECGMRLYL